MGTMPGDMNVGELISDVVYQRKTFTYIIEKYLEEKNYLAIDQLENLKFIMEEIQKHHIIPPENPLQDINIINENKDHLSNLIKKMQEQILLITTLIRMKKCPITQIIDKL